MPDFGSYCYNKISYSFTLIYSCPNPVQESECIMNLEYSDAGQGKNTGEPYHLQVTMTKQTLSNLQKNYIAWKLST